MNKRVIRLGVSVGVSVLAAIEHIIEYSHPEDHKPQIANVIADAIQGIGEAIAQYEQETDDTNGDIPF